MSIPDEARPVTLTRQERTELYRDILGWEFARCLGQVDADDCDFAASVLVVDGPATERVKAMLERLGETLRACHGA